LITAICLCCVQSVVCRSTRKICVSPMETNGNSKF